jgi:hypothetical protein
MLIKYPNGHTLISRLYHSFLRSTSNSSTYSAAVLIVLTMVFARPEAFGAGPSISKIRELIVLACAIHLAMDAIFIRKIRAAWFAAGLLILLMIQSWVSIFAPAVYMGTPIQDFMLARGVSAYFQWDYAIKLLGNLGLMFLMISVMPAIYRDSTPTQRMTLKIVIFFVVIANTAAALIQGFYSLSFLSSGSGSAVSANRAPALFEDSGASTVIFAALVSLAVGWSLTAPRILAVLSIIVLAVAGYQTGGRTFFVSSFAGCTAVVLIYLSRVIYDSHKLFTKRRALTVFLIVTLVSYLYRRIPDPVISVIRGFLNDVTLNGGFFDVLAKHLWYADPVRSTSLRVMMLTAKAHYLDGAGFGTYQTYFREHVSEVARIWNQAIDWVDLPATIYASIPAELGSVNAYLIVILLIIWTIFRRDTLWAKASIPVTGALVSIACSFWFGTHLIFQSFTVGMGLLFAAVEFSSNQQVGRIFIRTMLILIMLGISFSAAVKWHSASRQVMFRTSVFGIPQLPVPINAPISSRGRHGQWLASGAEVFYPGKPITVFVEQPADRYPIKVQWLVRGTDLRKLDEGEIIIDKLDEEKGGVDVIIGGKYGQVCPEVFSHSHYCSIQVSTSPSWKWGRDRLGWFYVKP